MNRLGVTTSLGTFLLLAAPGAWAACSFDVEVGDTLAFNTKEMTAEQSCETVTVNLTHTGKLPAAAMGHNWVLTADEADIQPIANDGMAAGVNGNYVDADDPRVIAATKLVGGGQSTSVEFSVAELDKGEYVFFCSFPGHWTVMKGSFKVT